MSDQTRRNPRASRGGAPSWFQSVVEWFRSPRQHGEEQDLLSDRISELRSTLSSAMRRDGIRGKHTRPVSTSLRLSLTQELDEILSDLRTLDALHQHQVGEVAELVSTLEDRLMLQPSDSEEASSRPPSSVRIIARLKALLKRIPDDGVEFQPTALTALVNIRDRIDPRRTSPPTQKWIDQMLLGALKTVGVSTFEDAGPVDSQRHQVLEAKPTDDPSLDREIAATLRVGYRTETTIIRPQQVVAWVSEPPRSPESPSPESLPSNR